MSRNILKGLRDPFSGWFGLKGIRRRDVLWVMVAVEGGQWYVLRRDTIKQEVMKHNHDGAYPPGRPDVACQQFELPKTLNQGECVYRGSLSRPGYGRSVWHHFVTIPAAEVAGPYLKAYGILLTDSEGRPDYDRIKSAQLRPVAAEIIDPDLLVVPGKQSRVWSSLRLRDVLPVVSART